MTTFAAIWALYLAGHLHERLIAAAHRQGPWETATQAFEKVAGFRWSLW